MKWNIRAGEAAENVRKAIARHKYILPVILVGLILLLLPTGEKDAGGSTSPAGTGEEEDFDLGAFETKLQEALRNMDGVGNVCVMLTLKTDSERVLATDRTVSVQSSGSGEANEYDMDSSQTAIVISKGSGTQEAVVVQRVYPQFQGALIICQGGGSSQVRLRVTEAVSAVTGLGSDQIHVGKMS